MLFLVFEVPTGCPWENVYQVIGIMKQKKSTEPEKQIRSDVCGKLWSEATELSDTTRGKHKGGKKKKDGIL